MVLTSRKMFMMCGLNSLDKKKKLLKIMINRDSKKKGLVTYFLFQ